LDIVKILVYGIRLGAMAVEDKHIFVEDLLELFYSLNSHFYKLVGTWIFIGYRFGGKIFNLLTNFYKLVEVKGIYPLFLSDAIKQN